MEPTNPNPDTTQRTADIRRQINTLTAALGQHAIDGVFAVCVTAASSQAEPHKTTALVVALSGELPGQCLADFQDLARRWGQDLHIANVRFHPRQDG